MHLVLKRMTSPAKHTRGEPGSSTEAVTALDIFGKGSHKIWWNTVSLLS